MPQITTDLTGIQDGDTLIWDAAHNKFVKGPAAAAPLVINIQSGDTLTDLGSGEVDGQLGIVRINDDDELRFRWRQSAAKWYAPEQNVLKVNDAWAVDLTNQLPSAWKNAWCRPVHGVGWYHGTRGRLDTTINSGATSVIIDTLSDGESNTFPAAGKVLIGGDVVTYTGRTDNGNGTVTLTGCSGVTETHVAEKAPVIPYDNINAGDMGGWGITSVPIDFAATLWTAGFRLRERVSHAHMNGSIDNQAMDMTVYWWNYDVGDSFAEPDPFTAPSGQLGKSLTITGPAFPGGSDLADDVTQERAFDIKGGDWTNWQAGTPTKEILDPYIYLRMPAGADNTGEMYGTTWQTQWYGAP